MTRWRSAERAGALADRHRTGAERLLAHLDGVSAMRWSTLARFAEPGTDVLDVERMVDAMAAAGLVEIAERPDRRGDWRPTRLRIADHGRAVLTEWRNEAAEADRGALLVAALHRIAADPEALPVPKRVLVLEAFGDTKAVRIEDYRDAIEAAFDAPLETLVQDWTSVVLTAGPCGYRFGGHAVDLRMSEPWFGVTAPVVDRLDSLWTTASEVITVENLAPFEALARGGAFANAIGIFTSGFLRRAQRRWLARLAALGGVTTVRHWGDLDAGGLLIYRQLRDVVAQAAPDVEVRPWRMNVSLLDEYPTRPLTAHDQRRLRRYLDDPTNPLLELASALLDRDCKLEQEALLLPDIGGGE